MSKPHRTQMSRLAPLCGQGLLLGTLFFAASLTPTLVPRTGLQQGILAGTCFALGYGIGVFFRWLWHYLGLPDPPERIRRITNILFLVFCVSVVLFFFWQAAQWQNSIRAVMDMEPVSGTHSFVICAAAVVTFVFLLALAKLFGWVARTLTRRLRTFVSPRLALVGGIAATFFLAWSLANHLLVRVIFNAVDASFRQYDALLEPERARPVSPARTGSPDSLLEWEKLGRAGREFIATGPDALAISAFTHRRALDPIRVYVGLRSADTVAERARLALDELKRRKGFERSALIIVTPTGTGWIDPAAMDAVEFLHEGDVASVAMQYSYLSSPLSLLAHPDYGVQASRALFTEIYQYWRTLPRDNRPRLYLHGLSLGAMNSERSTGLFELIGDPIDGALWSGPPFGSRIWRSITDARNAGSPAWLPTFHDGSLVRFMNQHGSNTPEQAPWGPIRVVYLQYASDPVTFFDYRSLYRRPAWMAQPRGPDVSPELRWYPIVTMLQLALDMGLGTTTPMGYGHVFAPEHYVDAWVAVADIHWPADQVVRLRQYLAARTRAAMSQADGTLGAYESRGG